MNNDSTYKIYAKKPEGIAISKEVSWPFYYWMGVIDASEIEDLDPLQHLILNLIAFNEYNKSELSKIVGISKEVLSAVEEKCMLQGYLSPNKKLTKECIKKFDFKKYNESDLEEADTGKKTIIFRDALSGDIVPYFDLNRINNFSEINIEGIVLQSGDKFKKSPTFDDLNLGLKDLRRISYRTEEFEIEYGAESEDLQQNNIAEFIEYDEDDEVFWEDETNEINARSDVIEREEGNDTRGNNSSVENGINPDSEMLKIKSSQSLKINLLAYICIHPDNINEYYVKSPFGRKTDGWFLNRIRKECLRNEDLKLELDLLKEEVKENFKDIYTFDNIYEIELLEKLPRLANYHKFENVKKEIIGVSNAYKRIMDGHKDYDTYFTRVQRTLECLLQVIVKDMRDWQGLCRKVYPAGYSAQIARITTELDINIPSKLSYNSMCKNINRLRNPKSGAIKDRAMMLLLEAYYEKKNDFVLLCKQSPDFYEKIVQIADTRNQHAHFNESDISRDEYISKVNSINDILYEIIMGLFNYYIKEN